MTYLQDNPPGRSQFRLPRRADATGAIVVHTAENGGRGAAGSAEAVAEFIQRRTGPGSYHTIADESKWIHLAPYEAEAFGEGTGGNRWALHLSFACRTVDWAMMPDDRTKRLLDQGARAAADMARWVKAEHGITVPARLITAAEYQAGQPGFISHAALDPTRRSDPGIGFPWARFLALFAYAYHMETPTMTTTEKPFAAQVNEALQLLTEHAGYTGALDGLFGPKALEALHRLKNRNESVEVAYRALRADHESLSALHKAGLHSKSELTTNLAFSKAESARLAAELLDVKAGLEAARADLDELRRRPASELVDALAVHVGHMATLLEDRP
jgi:hypothetical protein